FIILPGVPHEMSWLMEKWVIPVLCKKYKKKLGGVILHRTLLTIGIGESLLAQKIGEVSIFLEKGATLAYLTGVSGVRLRISVHEGTTKKAEEKTRRIEKYIDRKSVV